jgi:hypothetical protein
MKQLKPLLILCLCVFFGRFAQAQDLMYLRNVKEPVKVKVHEIGLDEIKYKPWGDTVIPVLVIPRMNVKKLVLSNGSVFEFSENPMADATNYSEQHNNAFKFHFLSPLFDNFAFSYERSIRPGRSYEVGVGVIGVGVDNGNNAGGMYIRGGYKFISSPDFYVRGMRYAHILKGGYIKPELIFGGYGVDRYAYTSYSSYSGYSNSSVRRQVTFGSLMVTFGKQWVFDDAFLFDMYFGLGYGFSKYSQTGSRTSYSYDEPEYYHYAFMGGMQDFPIAISAGFKIGFVFGKPQEPYKKEK